MSKRLKSVLYILSLLLLLTCDNGLDNLLELQRIMIPVASEVELRSAVAAAQNGSIIGLLKDIEIEDLSSEYAIEIDKTLTIIAWEGTKTLSSGGGFSYDHFFEIEDGGHLILGDSRSNGTLILEGNSSRGAPLIRILCISTPGYLTINNGVTLKSNGSNTYPTGGGVYVGDYGHFTMNGGTISSNSVLTAGGGVYITGTNSTFTMKGGIINGNRADEGGGVFISSSSTFTMNGGTITGNTAIISSNGGGVHNNGGTFNGLASDNPGKYIYGNIGLQVFPP